MSDGLLRIAKRVLEEHDFLTEIPAEVNAEAEHAEVHVPDGILDLRKLLWTSIDNEESRDLDQLEYAEALGKDRTKVFIAIADVDTYAPKHSKVDRHAFSNTATIYASVEVFAMIPEVLSCERTSLLPGQDRLAIVTEYIVHPDGHTSDEKVYHARVRNHHKLVYEDVGAFLVPASKQEQDRALDVPPAVEEQLRLQYEASKRLRENRIRSGMLEFESVEPRAIVKDGKVVDLRVIQKNAARELIENFMIAANEANARYLEACDFPAIGRVVRKPKRWDKIREIARNYKCNLPEDPSSVALAAFLRSRKDEAPEEYKDLSLTIVKLMGPGEYALVLPKNDADGHFGLATQDYAHSTAPNRRYADLVGQRLLKAASTKTPTPYSVDELKLAAQRCTLKETDARKVERTMRKVLAASALSDNIGDVFDGVITGASEKGIFVRTFKPLAEGRVIRGEERLDVGDKVRVKLLSTNIERGFIDFECVG